MRALMQILAISLLITACMDEKRSINFDVDRFRNPKFNTILAFDLRRDSQLIGALVVSNKLPHNHYTTNLYFPVTNITNSKNLLSTSSSYSEFTLLDFDISNATQDLSAISFYPIFENVNTESLTNYGYQKKLYLLKQGLSRHFIYNYEDTKIKDTLKTSTRNQFLADIESISVLLPNDSKGLEIRGTKRTSIPNHINQINSTFFYPSGQPPHKEPRLEIKYLLNETKGQKQLVDGLIKLIILLIPSGAALLLIQADEIINPSIRRIGIWLCIVLVIICLFGVSIYSFYFQDADAQKGMIDILIVVVGVIFSAFVYMTKKKKEGSSCNNADTGDS